MKRKDIKERIREYFFIYPTAKLRVREIERILGLPLPSVIRYCRALEQEDILMISKIGEVNFYTASRSATYLLEKKLYNLKQLYASGLIEYLKIELSNPVVVVFGSYSKGEDIEESDIDLYLETQSKKKVDFKRFEKILNRKIQVLSHKNIKEIKNLYLANNILNGITLNGVLEVFR